MRRPTGDRSGELIAGHPPTTDVPVDGTGASILSAAERETLAVGLLDNNATLITGGGSGLGRAIVARFIKEGAKVGVLERSPEKSEQLAYEFGSDVTVTIGDVRSAEDNTAAVANTI